MSDLDASFVIVDDNSKRANHPSINPNYTPGSHSSYAHDWSIPLSIHGRHFIDGYGRVCSLRGANVSGCSKSPVNHDDDVFPALHNSATFVGRPFPLEEAEEHFSRLRRWGMSFIRFLVTWEAIEHEGLGIYDHDYLTYIRELLSMLPKFGMTAFVCLHQDVWSRYSGGSGAPAWTLEAAGFDLHALEESGAAWLLGVKGGGHVEAERGIWPCGYQKLAAATMATCFWAGRVFAPKLMLTDRGGKRVNIQDYLQNAFLDAYDMLVRAVGDLPGVIGFEPMNEPHRGYIGLPNLHEFDYNTDLHLSHVPSALQSFLLGAGYPTRVYEWVRSFPMPTRRGKQATLNSAGRKAWLADGPTGGKDLWQMHGVWDYDRVKEEGIVLRQNYFVKHPVTGEKVDWYDDFYFPFLKQWSSRVRRIIPPSKLVFFEPIPNEFCPSSWTPENQVSNMVFAPHWYDLNTLFTKAFGDFSVNVQGLSRGMFPLKAFYWGQKGARDNYKLQIKNIVEASYRELGEMPVCIGECGVPMDMNKKEAFHSDDWTWQARAMDALHVALEGSLVSFCLWNYNPSNDDEKGDHWNGENFSWFSRRRGLPPSLLDYDQTSPTLDNGARILQSIVRPYPAKTAGIPLKFEYEVTDGTFTFEWITPHPGATFEDMSTGVHNPPINEHVELKAWETEIFVPSSLTVGKELIIEGLNEKDRYVHDEKRQTLFIVPHNKEPGRKQRIKVSVNPPPEPIFQVNDLWDDFGSLFNAAVFAFMAISAYWLLQKL